MLDGYAGINVMQMSYYPTDLRGLGTGWAKSAGRIGTILAPILIGIALQQGVTEQDVFSMFAIPTIMAMTAMLVIKTLKPS
jgi:AAHS family 4-hydroxybenzoate transporter-like MFS transporter